MIFVGPLCGLEPHTSCLICIYWIMHQSGWWRFFCQDIREGERIWGTMEISRIGWLGSDRHIIIWHDVCNIDLRLIKWRSFWGMERVCLPYFAKRHKGMWISYICIPSLWRQRFFKKQDIGIGEGPLSCAPVSSCAQPKQPEMRQWQQCNIWWWISLRPWLVCGVQIWEVDNPTKGNFLDAVGFKLIALQKIVMQVELYLFSQLCHCARVRLPLIWRWYDSASRWNEFLCPLVSSKSSDVLDGDIARLTPWQGKITVNWSRTEWMQ